MGLPITTDTISTIIRKAVLEEIKDMRIGDIAEKVNWTSIAVTTMLDHWSWSLEQSLHWAHSLGLKVKVKVEIERESTPEKESPPNPKCVVCKTATTDWPEDEIEDYGPHERTVEWLNGKTFKVRICSLCYTELCAPVRDRVIRDFQELQAEAITDLKNKLSSPAAPKLPEEWEEIEQ